MAEEQCALLLMVDLPAQIAAMDRLPMEGGPAWHVFIKVDAGYQCVMGCTRGRVHSLMSGSAVELAYRCIRVNSRILYEPYSEALIVVCMDFMCMLVTV